jgi:hypothetical protein
MSYTSIAPHPYPNCIGATYDEFLKAGVATVLLCNSATPNLDKITFATDNDIPTVTEEWLWACLEASSLQDFDSFPVQMETPTVPAEYHPQKSRMYKQETKPTRSFKMTR